MRGGFKIWQYYDSNGNLVWRAAPDVDLAPGALPIIWLGFKHKQEIVDTFNQNSIISLYDYVQVTSLFTINVWNDQAFDNGSPDTSGWNKPYPNRLVSRDALEREQSKAERAFEMLVDTRSRLENLRAFLTDNDILEGEFGTIEDNLESLEMTGKQLEEFLDNPPDDE